MAADVAAGGGDVGCVGESVQAEGQVAQGGHHGGNGSGADLGMVFGEDDIADPVQAVLATPSSRIGTVALVGRGHGVTAGYTRSDREHKLGERNREPMPAIDVGAKFVMTATQVLDEGVPGADHLCRPGRRAAHGADPAAART